jgi:pimeloyl-ACP methyl ester carboxylesterase
MKKLERNLALLLVLVLLAGFFITHNQSNNKSWNLEKYNSQNIKWEDCYQNFKCGTFKVPIDYSAPESGSFTLQILKHQATDGRHRLGAILVNPGGPGGSAYDYAMSAHSIVSDQLNSKYDIVGFDGRGIGESEPVRCLTDSAEDKFIDIDGADNSKNTLIDAAKSFAQACSLKAGIKLGHLSTFETAKDMEILRHLLHEPKLNFLGKSYGTYLGAIFISLYPDSVGRFVLDGAVDPNISIRDQSLNQTAGFEHSLNDFLNANPKFTKTEIQKLIEDAATHPLRDRSGRALSRSLAVTAIAASLYDNALGWANLKVGLTRALTDGNPDRLLSIADDYNNRDSSGHYFNNQNDIGIAINCLDWNTRSTYQELTNDLPNFIKASETFGKYIAYGTLPCTYWKAQPLQPNLPFKNIKSTRFMIIGVTKDPATPYVWAENLAQEFPDSVLLTLNGDGHTGHNRGVKCIDSKVDAYFLRGELPKPGVSCVAGGN